MNSIYIIICIVGFLIGAYTRTKLRVEVLVLLLILAPCSILVTMYIVSGLENIDMVQTFNELLTFKVQSSRASVGLYLVSALFFYTLGLLITYGKKKQVT